MLQSIGYDPAYLETEKKHHFPIEPERHLFIAGETGTGKSSLFRSLISERLEAGDSILLVDPHGPLAEDTANDIPRHKLNDVIYFDPLADNPLSLNPFDHPDPALARTLIKDLIEKTWPQGWGPQTDDILTFTLIALQDAYDLPTLPLAQRFLRSTKFRKEVLSKVKDVETLAYFQETYDGDWDKRMRAEKSAPVFNKLNKFVNEPVLRSIFNKAKSLDFRQAIDNKAILIFNLSQARIGRPNTAFIGGVVAFKHQQALLSRQDLLSQGKTPPKSFAYYDEFQIVMGADISVYLNESRKYGGSLALGTQSFTSLPDATKHMILTNCGNQVIYRVSREDAEIFAKEFGEEFSPTALTRTLDFHFYANVIRNHTPQKPTLLKAFRPGKNTDATFNDVLKQMAHNFGAKSKLIEMKKEE